MNQDDDYDMPQYPDFLDAMPGLQDDLFSNTEETADENGIIECAFLPLRDIVLFPQMVMPLFVGREKSLLAVQAAVDKNENLIVATQRDSEVLEPKASDIFSLGTEVAIGKALKMPDNSTSVLAQGRRRVEIVEFLQWEPYIRVRARMVFEPMEWDRNTEALMRAVLTLFEKMVSLNRSMPEDALTFAINIGEPGWLADFVASTLTIPVESRQEILETLDPSVRLQRVSIILAKELDMLELEDQIHTQVQQEVDRSQREHFLREQMRVIQGELGEMDVFTQELHEIRDTAAAKDLPKEVRARVEKEIARLSAMPPMSPEVGIIRNYIDWVLALPWAEASIDNLDVRHAAEVLDGDHYGLDKAKDRILEFIAVKKIASHNMRSPILCFVGPPGTGKTSMGRSIANALGREFVRISLGGVRDEAEIRGHRRTYIGALPGRILQAMRRAGKRNPLFMLDEIDKLGHDFRGDPSSALLEVLDPEQNSTFSDHYLELDYDLSGILFITTANFLDTIPPALQDRMEVIEFSGYLEEEKLEICRQFLVNRQLEHHGLTKLGIRFEDEALKCIITNYTLEAGVRNLEREIANVCRKVARNVAEEKRFTKRLTAQQIESLLGPPRFSKEMLQDEDEVGVATGAAWTPAGGDIMFIEVNLMPGKGRLTLTGKLGDVMQESAQAALTYTRSQAIQWGIDPKLFEQTDVHIHVPEGAVPKDGPSAGVPLVTALISAFAERPIRRDVSMTGEITLRGRVLAVGGVREKVLAARRAGIHTFVLPQKNESDLENIPKRLRQDMSFVLVERVQQVLETALLPAPFVTKQRRVAAKISPIPTQSVPPA
ncbi:MAG: endopeptidase La [Anaerolineales bacterium]|nr:endopeptidase La [Anaerolineales bacterium]